MIDESEEFDELETVRKGILQLALVKEMVHHPGWEIVVTHFNHVIKSVGDALDIEEDYKKIMRLQERKRAFKSMLEAVNALCEQHSEEIARLESMETDKQERDQYGL